MPLRTWELVVIASSDWAKEEHAGTIFAILMLTSLLECVVPGYMCIIVYIYNYIYYISICIYTALCNHRRGPISQVLGVFSSHGYLRSQVHAAIENVGLKEVWLKIAGGEKAMRPRDWGNPSPLGFVVLGM